jgi:mycothiol synthase
MSQLFMKRPDLEDLPEVRLPPGYGMRIYRPGDEAIWAYIMSKTIGGSSDPDRCRREIIDKPQFSPDRLFFVTYEDTPVGSACAWQQLPDEREAGYVHMVGVLEEHRGKRLGYMLTLRTLHWFRDHGFKCATLHTDDFRIPAIKTYLKLGFIPVFTDDTHPGRWRAIRDKLGISIPGIE